MNTQKKALSLILGIALAATFLACRESSAIIPTGYVYEDCPSNNWYSVDTGRWYYINPDFTVVGWDYCFNEWFQDTITPSDICEFDDSGWGYYVWPYVYFPDDQCWEYIASINALAYDYSTGTWSVLGQP